MQLGEHSQYNSIVMAMPHLTPFPHCFAIFTVLLHGTTNITHRDVHWLALPYPTSLPH